MDKVDLKKAMKPYWSPPLGRFEMVEVPRLNFLMVDGRGDPSTAPGYANAVQWLFSASYAVKFASKAQGRDYTVAPLEGLWWADDMASYVTGDRENWLWTMMVMQPDWVSAEDVSAAISKAGAKLGTPPPSLRFEPFAEGLCAQIMHICPYSEEAPTIARLHDEFLPANGLKARGHHHEIYLGDPRRLPADKLRTVIRQPVERA